VSWWAGGEVRQGRSGCRGCGRLPDASVLRCGAWSPGPGSSPASPATS
jgi:hypothetical protein